MNDEEVLSQFEVGEYHGYKNAVIMIAEQMARTDVISTVMWLTATIGAIIEKYSTYEMSMDWGNIDYEIEKLIDKWKSQKKSE